MSGQTRQYLLAIVCAVSCTACYSYAPIQTPQPGMEVRARLTGEAAARHSEGYDDPIVQYDGTVIDVSGEALSIDVLVARSSSAFQDVVIRDTVQLRRTEIQSMLQRKISTARTALFAIGAVAGAAVVVMGIDQVVGGTDDPPDGGDPTFRDRPIPARARVPIGFRIPFR